MSGERFTLDTNILVYSIDHDAGLRHDVAREIIVAASSLDCCLMLQSLSEFYAAATRKRRMERADATRYAEYLLNFFPANRLRVEVRCPNRIDHGILQSRLVLGRAAGRDRGGSRMHGHSDRRPPRRRPTQWPEDRHPFATGGLSPSARAVLGMV